MGLKENSEAYLVLKELPTLEMMEFNKAHEKGEGGALDQPYMTMLMKCVCRKHDMFLSDYEFS